MSHWTLTKTRLAEGHWHGILHGGQGTPPDIVADHLGRRIEGITLTPADGGWAVDVPLPASVLSDGAQCVILRFADEADSLAVITLIAGEDLAHDLRAEVAVLRAELDLLKRAFRQHCAQG